MIIDSVKRVDTETILCVPKDAGPLLAYVFKRHKIPAKIRSGGSVIAKSCDFETRKRTYVEMADRCHGKIGYFDRKNMKEKDYQLLINHFSLIIISNYDIDDLLEFCINMINSKDEQREYREYRQCRLA
jgi:hypothetical protein